MAESRGVDWRLLVPVWLVLAAIFAARALLNLDTVPLLADTDDAMRVVVVRDLLAGQGWYDHLQHRMNTPFGGELHWSRFADLPLALLMLVLRPVLGANADIVAAFVLPLLLLLPTLWLVARIAVGLAGREGLLPGLVLPALSLSVLGEFTPGRVDHHALQIILALVMLWCTLEAVNRPRFAIGAGIAAATALAIGIESLPAVVAAILACGLVWVVRPTRADALRGFGLSFGGATLVHLALALGPAQWLATACDALSLPYAGVAVAVGLSFVVLSLLPLERREPAVRLAAGIAAGFVVAVGFAALFPACLRGPYGQLDPWLAEHWIARVTEAEPFWVTLRTNPVYALAVAVPVLVAIAATSERLFAAPRERRPLWLAYAAFLALAALVMLLQIRASRMATLMAVPAAAWLIIAARHAYLANPRLRRVVPLLLAWVASAGLAVAVVVSLGIRLLPAGEPDQRGATATAERQCFLPGAYAALAAMPPERIMAPVDLGSHLLLFTPHEVVGAPYHRNEAGVRDTFDFFNLPIAVARQILQKRGISLVVLCATMPEIRGLPDAAPDSFARLYAKGELPDWLVDYSLPDTPLRVLAVLPPGQNG